MKVKLGSLFASIQPFNKIAKANLPIVTSFRIGKFLEKAQKELTVFEQKRVELVKKYAKKDKKGEINEKEMKVDEKNLEAFQKDFEALAALEAESDFDKLKLSELINVELTPAEIGLVKEFIDDDVTK